MQFIQPDIIFYMIGTYYINSKYDIYVGIVFFKIGLYYNIYNCILFCSVHYNNCLYYTLC